MKFEVVFILTFAFTVFCCHGISIGLLRYFAATELLLNFLRYFAATELLLNFYGILLPRSYCWTFSKQSSPP